ncbi:MAG: hypothetical protein AB7F88_19135 [Pyrinomonadaceae bacterium]
MKIQSENIAFDSDQLITCPKCGKSNPPNRLNCLYCGGAIEIPDELRAEVKPNLRKLEAWENGFNVVMISRDETVDAVGAARYLGLDAGIFEEMLAANDPFPLARIESEMEAGLAVTKLSTLGIVSTVVSDIDLKIGKPNIRLRSIGFSDGDLLFTTFNTGEQFEIPGSEILLVVVGRIVESRLESVEKGKKDKRKVLAETSASSDEVLIDIYAAGHEQGWRVATMGFDFSTLGKEKRLLAVENIQVLFEKLRSFASSAAIAEEYPNLINQLSEVWDIERRTDFGGIKRTGVMRSGFSTVARTSNLEQFTRYSRLQRILI